MKIQKNKKYTFNQMERLLKKAKKVYKLDDNMEVMKKFNFKIVIEDKVPYCIIKD